MYLKLFFNGGKRKWFYPQHWKRHLRGITLVTLCHRFSLQNYLQFVLMCFLLSSIICMFSGSYQCLIISIIHTWQFVLKIKIIIFRENCGLKNTHFFSSTCFCLKYVAVIKCYSSFWLLLNFLVYWSSLVDSKDGVYHKWSSWFSFITTVHFLLY